MKLNRSGRFGLRYVTLRVASFGIAHFGRTEIERAMRDDTHGIQQFATNKLHPDDAVRRSDLIVLLKREQMIRKPEIGPVAQQADELIGGVQQIHPRATPALLRFQE